MARSEMVRSVDELVRRERQRWAVNRGTVVAVVACALVYAALAYGVRL